MNTRKMVYMALLLALGIILPLALHYFGPAMGTLFSPMHIPVFLAGAIFGPLSGALLGGLTPLLNSLLTGMPPVLPILPVMFVELIIYGLIIGYLYRRRGMNIYVALIISMIVGRIGAGVVVWLLVNVFSISNLPVNPLVYIWGSIAKSLPGIVIQLIIIPLLVKYLAPRGEIPSERSTG